MAVARFDIVAFAQQAVSALRDVRDAVSDVNRKLDRVDGRRVSARVDANTRPAEAALRRLEQRLSTTTIRAAALHRATAQLAIPSSLFLAAPQLLSLAAAVGRATGSLLTLPAAATGAATAMATLVLGFQGVGLAVKALSKDDLGKFNKALESLSPAARGVALAVRDLQPAWRNLRLDVQQRLFTGMTAELNKLAVVALPVLRKGLGGVAEELNMNAHLFSVWGRQAATVNDVKDIFFGLRRTMAELQPVGLNISQIMLDITAVGVRYLPQLANEFTDITGKVRVFVQEARQSGKIDEWISRGIDSTKQLGRVLINTVQSFGLLMRASELAGASTLDTLERATESMKKFLGSTAGREGLVTFFRTMRETAEALAPGLRVLADAVLSVVRNMGQGQVFQTAAAAVSRFAEAAAPMVRWLGQLASVVLPPLVAALGAIAPLLAPIVVGFYAMDIASRRLGQVRGILDGIGKKAAEAGFSSGVLVEKFTGSTKAGEKFVTAGERLQTGLTKLSAALPYVALAVVALGFAYDALKDKSDALAQSIVTGSKTLRQAIEEEAKSIDRRGALPWESVSREVAAADAAAAEAEARHKVVDALDKQLARLAPVDAAQVRARLSQEDYNAALHDFGADSPQAAAAAVGLAAANDRVASAQRDAAEATKTHTQKLVDQMELIAGAADANVGYRQAVLNVAKAQQDAAKALKDSGADSLEYRDAVLNVEQAELQAATAAQKKAEAAAVATGATNAAEIGAQAYKEELLRLADQAAGRGDASTAARLREMARGTVSAQSAAETANYQAALYRDELSRLADQAAGPTRTALDQARDAMNRIASSHDNARQKTENMIATLDTLIATSQGPLRVELENMRGRLVAAAGDYSIRVTAEGRVTVPGRLSTIGWGVGGIATGGVLGTPTGRGVPIQRYRVGGVVPGYSPGRDDHFYQLASGGTLALSGGEAVLRPEFTRAVGPQWVHAVNRSAREGGVAGVRDYLNRTSPRRPGVEGVRGDGSRFATGGILRYATGGIVPLGEVAPRATAGAVNALLDRLVPIAIKAIFGDAQRALSWARTQSGKPYIWGGVGPGGYDCSGFISAVLNVMQGRNPYVRRGTSATFPWPGFLPGLGGQFSVGAFAGDPGHMAGTLLGHNVESAGSVGVRVDGPVGANSGMFSVRAHIGDRGLVLPTGHAAMNFSGFPELLLPPRLTAALMHATGGNDKPRVVDASLRIGHVTVADVDELGRLERQRRSVSLFMAGIS